MTLLRNIAVYLKTDEFSDIASDFLFSTCYIRNYLKRRVRRLRFQADGFRAVMIEGQKSPGDPWIDADRYLTVPIAFDLGRYLTPSDDDQHEFFLGMFIEGLEKAAVSHEIPLEEILGFVEDFRNGDYRNEWVHKKKLLRGTGLRAFLLCSMDSEKFQLRLRLERKKEAVFDKVILETKPDELCFHHKFKDVIVEDGMVVVTNRMFTDTTLFSLDLSTLE